LPTKGDAQDAAPIIASAHRNRALQTERIDQTSSGLLKDFELPE
jgi:hypothetical protein